MPLTFMITNSMVEPINYPEPIWSSIANEGSTHQEKWLKPELPNTPLLNSSLSDDKRREIADYLKLQLPLSHQKIRLATLALFIHQMPPHLTINSGLLEQAVALLLKNSHRSQ